MQSTVGIGELARQTGLKIETIRYYEHEGLVPAPARSAGGHRRYGEPLQRRLTFIRRSRELGFTLEEVRQMLDLVDGEQLSCGEVRAIAKTHLTDVRAKIHDLERLERTLARLVRRCSGGATPQCPLIDALFDD